MPSGIKDKPFPRTMTPESEQEPLWEFHKEWENKASFILFNRYFLPLSPQERSLARAFREYCVYLGRKQVIEKLGYKNIEQGMRVPLVAEELLAIHEEQFKHKHTPNNWRVAANATNIKNDTRLTYIDTKGKERPIPTWAERADAYDRNERLKEQQKVDAMRQAEVEREILATDYLWNTLETMLRNAPAVVVSQEVEEPERDDAGRETGRIRVVQTVSLDPVGMTALVRSAALLSTERRRALGMATEITEARMSGIAGQPPIAVEHSGSVGLSIDEKLRLAKKRIEEQEAAEEANPEDFTVDDEGGD